MKEKPKVCWAPVALGVTQFSSGWFEPHSNLQRRVLLDPLIDEDTMNGLLEFSARDNFHHGATQPLKAVMVC